MILPEIRALLDTHLTPPSGAKPTVEGARAGNTRLGAVLGGEPLALPRVEDRRLPVPNMEPINARIYRPRLEADQPMIAYLHGGGWISGTLDAYDPLCRALAFHSQATVIAVDYPVAPEHPFPEPVAACSAAIDWIRRNAVELGGDPRRIAIAGDSAGANLAAVTAPSHGKGDELPSIAHLGLIYPILDARMNSASYRTFENGYYLTAAAMRWYWDIYLGAEAGDRTNPNISPGLMAEVSALPATTILVAECDPLRDEALSFASRLAKCGTDISLRIWPGTIHGFLRFLGPLASARAAVRWFGTTLGAALAEDNHETGEASIRSHRLGRVRP